jgi:sn-glycerol 3-phosphate transport system substrate-binding protein
VATLRTSVARLGASALAVAVAGLGASTGAEAGEQRARCPVRALDRSEGTVEITFWHVQQARSEEILTEQIEAFEASQERVRVDLVNVLTYPDVFEKYKAALATDGLPDLVQMDESSVQSLVDSESTIPMGRCVRADDYSLEDFVPHALDYYTTEGVLRAMPWTVSNPVLFFNKNHFRAAGLDPEDPPETLDEVTEFSRRIVDAGVAPHGMTVRAEAFVNEAFYAKSGQLYMDNGNGREARATKTRLNTRVGSEIWTWWDDLVESGLGLFTGSQPDNFDNLYALGNGDATMTIDTSNAIGSILSVLDTGEFGTLDLGVAQLPSLEPGGGVPVFDASLWIPETGSNEREAAAWELVKFLSAPEQQAQYAVENSGGYIPIRGSAIDDPALQTLWAESPDLMVPFEQLEAGRGGAAAAGAVTGDYAGVRAAVRDALTAMFTDDLPPRKALAQAQRDATQAIREYNERLAG